MRPSEVGGEGTEEFIPLNSNTNSNNDLIREEDRLIVKNDRKDDERKTHGRFHSRNLSIYFPHPNNNSINNNIKNNGEDLIGSNFDNNNNNTQEQIIIPSKTSSNTSSNQNSIKPRRGHHHRHSLSHNFFPFLQNINSSNPNNSRLSPNPTSIDNQSVSPSLSSASLLSTPATSPTSKRFRINNGTQANQNLQSQSSKEPLTPLTPLSAIPKSVPQLINQSRYRSSKLLPTSSALNDNSIRNQRYSHLPFLVRLVIGLSYHTDQLTKLQLLLAIFETFIGFSISVHSVGSLSLIGLSYVIVFDSIGSVSQLFLSCTESRRPRSKQLGRQENEGFRSKDDGKNDYYRRNSYDEDDGDEEDEEEDDPLERVWDILSTNSNSSQIRFPFGRSRINTLTYLTQSIYLIFSGVYILKEAIERILISQNGAQADGHNHGHNHGQSENFSSETNQLQIRLTFISLTLTIITSKLFKNHFKLKSLVFPRLRFNPFNLFSIGFQILIVFSLLLRSISTNKMDDRFDKIDKGLSVFGLICIFKLSIPTLKLMSKTLLQTLPPVKDFNPSNNNNNKNDRSFDGSYCNSYFYDGYDRSRILKKNCENAFQRVNKVYPNFVRSIEPIKVWELDTNGKELIGSLIVNLEGSKEEDEGNIKEGLKVVGGGGSGGINEEEEEVLMKKREKKDESEKVIHLTEIVRECFNEFYGELTVDVRRAGEVGKVKVDGGCDGHHHHHHGHHHGNEDHSHSHHDHNHGHKDHDHNHGHKDHDHNHGHKDHDHEHEHEKGCNHNHHNHNHS